MSKKPRNDQVDNPESGSKFNFFHILERFALGITIITALVGGWLRLYGGHPPHWLDTLEKIHYVVTLIVELVLCAIFYLLRKLQENIKSGILTQLRTIEPHLGIVTKQTHRELYEFSSDLLSFSGAVVAAIGNGTIDYEQQVFSEMTRGNRRLYSEFLYYWVIESILSLKASEVTSLKMMHYLPSGGIYPIFIRRFQDAQRRIPSDSKVQKLYRFRSRQYYDPDPKKYVPGSRQLFWSQLLMEEYGIAEVLVDYGADKATRVSNELQETIIIEFKPGFSVFKHKPITRLFAVAEKDRVSFEFLKGKIVLER